MAPSKKVGYGEIVSKQCNAGYEIEAPLTGDAVCGDHCQYSVNHAPCAPKHCTRFVPQGGNVRVSDDAPPYLGKTTFKCDVGYGIKVRSCLRVSCYAPSQTKQSFYVTIDGRYTCAGPR